MDQGLNINAYWSSNCAGCALKARCTTGRERRVRRWEHEAVIDAMFAKQARLAFFEDA